MNTKTVSNIDATNAGSPILKGDENANQTSVEALHIADQSFERQARLKNDILFASSHFLLHPGARIAVLNCGDGAQAFAMASVNPRLQIIGIDPDSKNIESARENYRLPNLKFELRVLATHDDEELGALKNFDGVLNLNSLHRLYSYTGYSRKRVVQALKRQIDVLQTGGSLVVMDYIKPSQDANQLIFIELPESKHTGRTIENMNDAELLIHFSQTARPLDRAGCGGFFLQEVTPKNEKTRLFKIPYKWAVEFMLRRHKRSEWAEELNKEYTYFSAEEFRAEINRLGARVIYSAPRWDHDFIERHVAKRMRFYDLNFERMDYPPTSFIAVAQSIDKNDSVIIQERRMADQQKFSLRIDSLRNEKTGKIHDLVSRPFKTVNIVPFRRTTDGRVTIFACENLPEPVINSIERRGRNLDERHWSGYIVEPLQLEIEHNDVIDIQTDEKRIGTIIDQQGGLKLKKNGLIFNGPSFYANPALINERTDMLFVEVSAPESYKNTTIAVDKKGYNTKASVKAYDAQDILRAAHVGLLADGRLENATYILLGKLGVPTDEWTASSRPILNYTTRKWQVDDLIDVVKEVEEDAPAFTPTMRSGNTIEKHRSVFVEEAFEDEDPKAMNYKGVDFIIPKDDTTNIAVVIPMTRDLSGDVLMGLNVEPMPVPQRLEGRSAVINVPTFVLPEDIRNIDQAKAYVAEQFGKSASNVHSLGASYFVHTGLTPQRVYPFMIASDPSGARHWTRTYAREKVIRDILWDFMYNANFLKLYSRSCQMLGVDHSMSMAVRNDASAQANLDSRGMGANNVDAMAKYERVSAPKSSDTQKSAPSIGLDG